MTTPLKFDIALLRVDEAQSSQYTGWRHSKANLVILSGIMEEPSYTVPVYQFEMQATRSIQIIIIHNLFQTLYDLTYLQKVVNVPGIQNSQLGCSYIIPKDFLR